MYWQIAIVTLLLISSVNALATATIISNVRLFDGENVYEKASVKISGNRIVNVSLGGTIHPDGAEVLDGTGLTLLPGLIDSHTHNFGDALALGLNWGVTTHLDMLGDPAFLVEQKTLQPQPSRADIFGAGNSVTVPGGHGTQFAPNTPTLKQAEQAEAFVAERVAEGSDFIKLILEDGSPFDFGEVPMLSEEMLNAAVAAVEQHGKVSAVHVSSHAGAEMAAAAGANGLVHIWIDKLASDELLNTLVGKDMFVAPTLTVTGGMVRRDWQASRLDDERVGPFLNKFQRSTLKASFGPNSRGDEFWGYTQGSVKALYEAGVDILVGTDAPNPRTAHGISMHTELRKLVEVGIPAIDALRGATSLPAKHFGLRDRGRIEAGLKADLLLVRGNPIQHIDDTLNIVGIWKDGLRYQRVRYGEMESEQIALGVLSDFATGLDARVGEWEISTDKQAGGSSTAELSIQDGQLTVSGTLTDDHLFPWAGVSLAFAEVEQGIGLDFSLGEGISFDAKGDNVNVVVLAGPRPKQKKLILTEEMSSYFVSFEELGVDPENVFFLLFSAAELGKFEFQIDNIALSVQ